MKTRTSERLHPLAGRVRILCMAVKPEAIMHDVDLAREAQTCRVQAEHFREPERKLLLTIAKVFDELASMTDARKAIDAVRCW